MNFKTDIENRIKTDFGENSLEVFKILDAAIQKNDCLKTDRIIRSILFLSERNIEKLKQSIEAAILDPRDVMFWAEYTIQEEQGTEKRVRDFNKIFEDCEINTNK